MEFTIHRDKLKDGLDRIKSVVPSGTANPILEHLLFKIEQNNLTVSVTNIPLSYIWKTKLDSSSGNASFSLPGITFINLVNSLDSSMVKFSYDKEKEDVRISCGKYTWDSSSGDISNYPNITFIEDIGLDLPKDFSDMLNKVYPSISNDVSKVDLNSLCLDINKDNKGLMSLISTDKFRLSLASSPFNQIKESMSLAIPRNSVSEIIKFNPTKMAIDSSLNNLYFEHENNIGVTKLKVSLNNVKYPDVYAYLTPNFMGSLIKLRKKDILSSLKRIKIISDKLDKIATFEFIKGKLFVYSYECVTKSKEEINLELFDENLKSKIKIKIDLILDYISQEKEESLCFKIVNDSFLLFDKPNYRHVLSVDKVHDE